MFHKVRNGGAAGTVGGRSAVEALRERLPPGWSVELRPEIKGGDRLTLRAPDGRRADLAVISRKRVSPKDVSHLVRQGEGTGGQLLVVAPFLSPRAREMIAGANASYVDGTGNLRVVVSDPAVFLEGRGADRDPHRQPRSLRSLKGAAAGRVVRALCDFAPPYGVRALAETSATPLGTVSRVVSFLEEEALITRDDKKLITAVDWPALIRRWVADYSVASSNLMRSYLEPRGLAQLAAKMGRLGRYAITGSFAGPGVAAPRLAMIYVDDAERAAQALELVPADAGANVWLLEPYDDVVFERTESRPFSSAPQATAVVVVAPSQAVADLMTSPGRGPQEAAALIEKLRGSEHVWRHKPRP